MTMIKKFAVEPRAVCRWENFRYVMEKLGFAQGRVLACYPKKWPRALLDELDRLGEVTEIERTRFVEKLRRYKEDRMVSLGAPYDPNITWTQNAVSLPSHKVDSIILEQRPHQLPADYSIQTISDLEEDFFSTSREVRCASTVENLFDAAQLLLSETPEAYFVDPHFKIFPDTSMKVLARFAEGTAATGKCQRFVLYTDIKYRPRVDPSVALKQFRERLATHATGLQVCFRFVDNTDPTNRLHARYLLTQKGGLRYDKGFEAPLAQPLVDISLLDAALHRELFDFYRAGAKDLAVRDTWSWVL